MNVAVLSGISRNSGGLYYAVSSLCTALAERRARITVFGREDPFCLADRGLWDPVVVQSYKSFGPLGTTFALRRMLKEAECDLLHQHGLWMDDQWAALQWQKKSGRPVVISPHGMLDPWAVRNSAWKKKLVGRLFADESLRRATCLHALCRSEADSIRKYGLNNPVAVIPNGVDLPDMPDPREENGGRRQLLFLGRIHPKKGLAELLAAWASAKRCRAACQLLIAGWDDGNHLGQLQRQAGELGLDWVAVDAGRTEAGSGSEPDHIMTEDRHDVVFLGPVFGQRKDRLLRRVDGFILPSYSEGLPMSVLEAWSYALSVIMTPYCNLPEGYAADAALKCDPDVESVARALETWASMDSAARTSMGRNGRRLVERNFTWDKVARDMKEVYTGCISRTD